MLTAFVLALLATPYAFSAPAKTDANSTASVTMEGWARPDLASFGLSTSLFLPLTDSKPSATALRNSNYYLDATTKTVLATGTAKLADYVVVGPSLYVEGVQSIDGRGVRQPLQVLQCKVTQGTGKCRLLEYSQKNGKATATSTYSATVTLSSTTITAAPLTKFPSGMKSTIDKFTKAA